MDVVALVAAVVVIAEDVVDLVTEEEDLAAAEVAEVSFFSNWLPDAGSQLWEFIQFQIWGT